MWNFNWLKNFQDQNKLVAIPSHHLKTARLVGFLPVEQRHDAEDITQSTHHSRQQSQDPRDKVFQGWENIQFRLRWDTTFSLYCR